MCKNKTVIGLISIIISFLGCKEIEYKKAPFIFGSVYKWERALWNTKGNQIFVNIFSEKRLDDLVVKVNDINIPQKADFDDLLWRYKCSKDTILDFGKQYNLNISYKEGVGTANCRVPDSFGIISPKLGDTVQVRSLKITWRKANYADWYYIRFVLPNEIVEEVLKDTTYTLDSAKVAKSAGRDLFIYLSAINGPFVSEGDEGNVKGDCEGIFFGEYELHHKVFVKGTPKIKTSLPIYSKEEHINSLLKLFAPYNDKIARIYNTIKE